LVALLPHKNTSVIVTAIEVPTVGTGNPCNALEIVLPTPVCGEVIQSEDIHDGFESIFIAARVLLFPKNHFAFNLRIF